MVRSCLPQPSAEEASLTFGADPAVVHDDAPLHAGAFVQGNGFGLLAFEQPGADLPACFLYVLIFSL